MVSKFDSQMAFSNFLISQVSSRFHLPIKKNYIFFAGDTNFKVMEQQTTSKSDKKRMKIQQPRQNNSQNIKI